MNKEKLASIIDYTVLKPDTKRDDIKKLCQEAKAYNMFSVCLNPYYISYAKELIDNSSVKLCSVIGFPLGIHTTEIKSKEAEQMVDQGVDEIDMPLNLGEFKDKNYKKVLEDISSVVKVCNKKCVKVIIGTSFLDKDEIKDACKIVMDSGASFVKTSTGFFKPGATVEDIEIMKKTVGNLLKIKASGGIRTYGSCKELIDAGADRIGTSSAIEILSQAN